MTILDEIYAHKCLEVAAAKRQRPAVILESAIAELPPPPGFTAALIDKARTAPRLIAEVKYRSPSKGVLRPEFDPLDLARAYAQNGAAAISVLTDEKFFGGSLEMLEQIAALDLGLPLLRKDFIFDCYQLLEARLAGASAVLLIVDLLDREQLRLLLVAAHALGLEAVVEAHNAIEVVQAFEAGARIIGVNNRDLNTFEVRLETCLELRSRIPGKVVMVAESGIRNTVDVNRLRHAGVDAMLIGEGLVTAPDVGAKIRMLVERP